MVRPYINVPSHISLYQTLLALAVSYTPIIPLAINVFTRGQRSNNQQISQISTYALAQIETLCQPVGQSLNLFHLQNVGEKSKEIVGYDNTLPEQNLQILSDIKFSCDETGMIIEELKNNERASITGSCVDVPNVVNSENSSEMNEAEKHQGDEIVTTINITNDVTEQENGEVVHENSFEENGNNFSFDESGEKDDLLQEKCNGIVNEQNVCAENDVVLNESEKCKEDVQMEHENEDNSVQAQQDRSTEGSSIEENVATKQEITTKCDVATNDDEPARKKTKLNSNDDDPGDIDEMLNSFIDVINE